jgi:hypothetical protein
VAEMFILLEFQKGEHRTKFCEEETIFKTGKMSCRKREEYGRKLRAETYKKDGWTGLIAR